MFYKKGKHFVCHEIDDGKKMIFFYKTVVHLSKGQYFLFLHKNRNTVKHDKTTKKSYKGKNNNTKFKNKESTKKRKK